MVKIQRIMVCLLALLIVINIFPVTTFAKEIINQNEGMVIDKTLNAKKSNYDSFTFVISNTVNGISEAEYSTEFTFTGKIQTGIKRRAVEGDRWYGTSDVVYEGLQIYTNSIEYKKINTDKGSVIDTGKITPNSYGLFFFNLKHNETIEFSVDNMGNMGFYLYETPNEQYETKAVLNENEYEGTTNVLTGEVIGVGAVPGGMETRYYESNVINIGKEYAPKLQPLTENVNVNYINTAKTRAQKYCVAYSFVSKTPGKKIPQEVMKLLPADQRDVPDGTEIKSTAPAQTKVSVTDGIWVFDGYTFNKISINGSDTEFIGRWSFYKKEKKPINNDNSDESSPQSESHASSIGNVQEETSTISDSPEKDINPDSADISENEISSIVPLDDSENHLRLGWITMLLMVCILQCVLSVSIVSDMHVLRWYAQKKQMR